MLWIKQSVAVGLAGLTPREAARGALLYKDFQYMLARPLNSDPFGDVLTKVEVSTH